MASPSSTNVAFGEILEQSAASGGTPAGHCCLRLARPRLASVLVGCGVSESGILSPSNLPRTLALRHDEDLAATNQSVGGSFVSSQRTVEPHNRCIGADEGQLFETLALNAIAENRPMDSSVPFLDSSSSLPHLARPQNPHTIVVEQACERVHVVRVPRFLPAINERRNLLPVGSITRSCALAHRCRRRGQDASNSECNRAEYQ